MEKKVNLAVVFPWSDYTENLGLFFLLQHPGNSQECCEENQVAVQPCLKNNFKLFR